MEHLRFATAVGARFEAFASELRQIHLHARLAGGLDARAVLVARAQALRQATEFVNAADALTSDYLARTVGGALVDADATQRGQVLVQQLREIAIDAVQTLMRKLRGAGLKTVLGNPGGALAALMRAADETLEFKSPDPAGRSWNAQALTHFLARDFGYQLAIDTQAKRLAVESDLAQVSYPDPTHMDHGLVVSLSGDTDGYPSLASVRATIFHPNASAQLTHVHPQ